MPQSLSTGARHVADTPQVTQTRRDVSLCWVGSKEGEVPSTRREGPRRQVQPCVCDWAAQVPLKGCAKESGEARHHDAGESQRYR